MKNKKITLILSFLVAGVLNGCSNAKQAEQINIQNEQLNTLANKLRDQEKVNGDNVKALRLRKFNEYIVKKGDTLLGISIEKQVSLDTLLSLNPWLQEKGIDVIYPNDVIKLN